MSRTLALIAMAGFAASACAQPARIEASYIFRSGSSVYSFPIYKREGVFNYLVPGYALPLEDCAEDAIPVCYSGDFFHFSAPQPDRATKGYSWSVGEYSYEIADQAEGLCGDKRGPVLIIRRAHSERDIIALFRYSYQCGLMTYIHETPDSRSFYAVSPMGLFATE